MKVRIIFALVLLASFNAAAETSRCSSAAIVQAEKLLSFHTDGDDRVEVDSNAKQLPSLTNPANKSQKLTVFEVFGTNFCLLTAACMILLGPTLFVW